MFGGSLKCAECLTGVWSKCKVSRFLRGVLLADAASFCALALLIGALVVPSPSTLSYPFSSTGLGRVLVTRRCALSVIIIINIIV